MDTLRKFVAFVRLRDGLGCIDSHLLQYSVSVVGALCVAKHCTENWIALDEKRLKEFECIPSAAGRRRRRIYVLHYRRQDPV